MLYSLKLANFRAYKDEQELEFARPGNDKIGFTVLVGPNNSGKSTPLYALKVLRTHRPDVVLDQLERHSEPVKIEINIEKGRGLEQVGVGEGEGAAYLTKFHQVAGVDQEFNEGSLGFVKLIPSRRAWNDTFNVAGSANPRQFERTEIDREKNAASALGQSLREVLREGRVEEFNNILKRFLPDLDSWSTDRIAGRDFVVYQPKNGRAHAMSDLGDGFSSAFRLAYTILYLQPGDALVLDEPDSHFIPKLRQDCMTCCGK